MTVTEPLTEHEQAPDATPVTLEHEDLPEPGRPIRRDPPNGHRGRGGDDYGYTYLNLLEPLLDADQFPYDVFYWVQRYQSKNGATNIVSNLNRGKNKIPDPPEGYSWVFRSARCRDAAGNFIDASDLFAKLTSGQVRPRQPGRPSPLPEHGPIPPASVSLPEPEQDKGAYVGLNVNLAEPEQEDGTSWGETLEQMKEVGFDPTQGVEGAVEAIDKLAGEVPNQPASSVMPDHEPVVETLLPTPTDSGDLPF